MKKSFFAVLFMMFLSLLFSFGIPIFMIYVAFHFIHKFW